MKQKLMVGIVDILLKVQCHPWAKSGLNLYCNAYYSQLPEYKGGHISGVQEFTLGISISCFHLLLCSEVHKLAEGLEVPDFWLTLGGQAKHKHFSPSCDVLYAPPMLFSVTVLKNTPSFLQHPAMKKEELLSSACYLFAYKDQVSACMHQERKP